MNIQKQKQIGDIVKFRTVDDCAGVVVPSFIYKRKNTWNDWNILKDQTGIILEVRSIENTINSEHQKYYQEKKFIPYFWYCFKTVKIYLVFRRELM